MIQEKKFNFVYLTICKINGKCYVGSHCTNNDNLDINKYYGGGLYFIKSFKKYKKENFHRIILKYCSSVLEARNLERIYIKLFDTLSPNGYNLSPTGGMGENQFGLHSDETKQKISKSNTGKEPWNKGKIGLTQLSNETKEKLKQLNLGENNPNYGNKGVKNPIFGVKKTKEHKEKLSITKLGSKNPNAGTYEIITPDDKKYFTISASGFIQEHPEYNINRFFIYNASKLNGENYNGWKIKKILNGNEKENPNKGIKRKPHTLETKEKIRLTKLGEKNYNYGKKHSEEHKNKIRISLTGSKNPNVGTYEITTPDNEKYLVISASLFIKEHPEYNINNFFIYYTHKIMGGNYKGWKIIKLIKNNG